MALQQRKIQFEAENFPHYFLCRYIPKGVGSDRMSKSLLAFKQGHPPHRRAWIDCAVAELKKIRALEGACVVRALGHNELQVRDHIQHSLDHLGVKLAHTFSGSYRADCLVKTREVSKLVNLSKAERHSSLNNAYRFSIPDRLPKRVLIIDDILTTGATVQSIMTAVLRAAPSCDISVFTLAMTDYDSALNSDLRLKSSYEWQHNDGWMLVAEDAPEYADALAKLKEHILNDTFI